MTPIPAGWKLVEALRESLLWTASSLAAVGKEQDVITLEGRKRTIGEILDEANAALDAPSPAYVAPGDAQDDPIGTLSRDADDMICFTPARDFHVTDGMLVFSAPAAGDALTDAARDVLAERQRQISAEGRTPENDDAYTSGELSAAAASYAIDACGNALGNASLPRPPSVWPWDASWWKPAGTRRNLVKAGALILAEIERLDRAAIAAQAQQQGEA